MEAIQFIQITPEQLQEAILKGVKKQIAELKKEFQPKNPTEYLTRQEACDLLKIKPNTLWSWSKKGKIKAYGIAGRVYYKRKEIEEAMTLLT